MARIQLVVAEDHPLTIAGLRLLIDSQADWELRAVVSDGAGLPAVVAQYEPDVVLLDLGLPGRTGIDILTELKQRHPTLRVVVLSGQEHMLAFRQALEARADAVLMKSESPDLLIHAVRAVVDGERFISPQLAERLGPVTAKPILTAREREVLAAMAHGLTSTQIGIRLGMSPATAKKHRENLMRKLGASNATATIRAARRLGLVAE